MAAVFVLLSYHSWQHFKLIIVVLFISRTSIFFDYICLHWIGIILHVECTICHTNDKECNNLYFKWRRRRPLFYTNIVVILWRSNQKLINVNINTYLHITFDIPGIIWVTIATRFRLVLIGHVAPSTALTFSENKQPISRNVIQIGNVITL